jgi:hypothetical protein
MLFSVVFSVDFLGGDAPSIRRSLRERLGVTREASEYRYLAEGDASSAWARAESLGGSGMLTRSEFAALLDDLRNPSATDAETLGTLGGHANPLGFAPDVDFSSDESAWILCLRVTPIPRRGNAACSEERAAQLWARIRAAFVARYADGFERGEFARSRGYAARVRRERREAIAFAQGGA